LAAGASAYQYRRPGVTESGHPAFRSREFTRSLAIRLWFGNPGDADSCPADSRQPCPAIARSNRIGIRIAELERPASESGRLEWTNTLAADGSIVRWNGDRGTWRWVDEKRGILLFDYTLHHPAVELVQIDLKSKPLKALVLCEDNYIFPVAKVKSTAAPESVAEKKEEKGNVIEAVKKLAAHEAAARKETATLIQSKNRKVAAWLLQQAPALPAAQARVVVERASELEGNVVSMEGAANASAAGGAQSKGLGGVWMWDRKNLEFADGGIVKVNGVKGGSWVWARPGSKNLIALTLEKDDVAALAWHSKSRDGVLHLMPIKGKQVEVPRQ
jgi:hypothetical protein